MNGMDGLTPTQLRVVALIADGLTEQEAARTLGRSHSTVRAHLEHARRRVGTPTTLQLVLTSIRRGWVHAPALTPADECVWRLRLEQHLLAAERHLRELAEDPLTPGLREFLAAFDEHLAARSWDEIGLSTTRNRMHTLLLQLLAQP